MRGAGARNEYHSVVLELAATADPVSVQTAVERMDLEFKGRGIERMTRLIRAGTALAATASVAVVAVATVHVMHVFMLLVFQRRRQIAVMRAVGASRSDVMVIVTLEAFLVGLLSGVFAVAAATVFGGIAERLLGGPIRELVLLQEGALFSPTPSVALLCVGLSVACCGVGAILGAARTVMKDPAGLFRS
jgi:putative ABC transport system permease protein